MNQNPSPELAPSLALVSLLTARPELHALVWTVGEVPGVLSGHHTSETGTGELADVLAEVAGGTVAHSSVNRGDDRLGVAHVVTTFEGASVRMWASYPLPDARGLTSTDLREMFSARRLGTLLCLPGGAQ